MRHQLPNDFKQHIEDSDWQGIKDLFATIDINAREPDYQGTALFFSGLSDEITLWLITKGADINARNLYGRTALHRRAEKWHENLEVLLENGADVNAIDERGNTPLHEAAALGNLDSVKTLINFGADKNLCNKQGYNALEYGLQQCSNIKIADIAKVAEFLLQTQQLSPKKQGLGKILTKLFKDKKLSAKSDKPQITPQMQDFVKNIGKNFEFYRDKFNKNLLEETSQGMAKLYQLFDVEPITPRLHYDGHLPIVAKGKNWQEQHKYLWDLLVPASGACTTIQGEVIRISGRLSHEFEGNGGGNYDKEYQKIAQAFLDYVKKGESLSQSQIDEAASLIKTIKHDYTSTDRLAELAVEWVRLNPKPIPLPKVNYKR